MAPNIDGDVFSEVLELSTVAPQSLDPEAEALAGWAAWAGQHGLLIFGVSMLVMLALAAAGWHVLRRHTMPLLRERMAPLHFLLLRMAAGFAVIVGGAAAFAEIADEIGAGEDLGPADEAFTGALRSSVPAQALRGFALITRLADPPTLAVLCVLVALALLVRGHRLYATAWVLALAGNALLNPALKAIFQRARPVHDEGLVLAQGFSFPSGHSSGSVVAYGMLAYLAARLLPHRWQLPVVLTAVAVASSVGASRVFLRVHYVSDVAAGFASGLAWLTVCVLAAEFTRRWHRPR